MKKFVLLLGLCWAAATAGVAAQESVTSASLSGEVVDPRGAVMPRVEVTATAQATNQAYRVVTDEVGRFRLPYLPAGAYEVRASASGFATAVRVVELTMGSAFNVTLRLAIAQANSSVEVTDAAPVIEENRSQVSETVLRREIDGLPFNGRNYLDLALLAPGVSPTNTNSVQTFAETSPVVGQGYSVNSQRNFSNSFVVDGLSANDDAAGLAGNSYSFDVVREFQVVTSGGQAEFGRALGGYLNVSTRSGGNEVRGTVYGYLKNQRLNAQNPLAMSRLPLTQGLFGVSLSGPLRRDRTFVFGNYEGRRLNTDGIVTISPVSAAAINARLSAVGYAGPRLAVGSSATTLYPTTVHTDTGFVRGDHRFSERDQFWLRYSFYGLDSVNARGVGGLADVSYGAGLRDANHTLAVSNIATLTPRVFNETRGQFTYDGLDAPPNTETSPAVTISGVATFGRFSSSPTARVNYLYEAVDNLVLERGPHSVKMGADFLFNDDRITFPQSIAGAYMFASLAAFNAGTYTNGGFTQSFGTPFVQQGNANVGVYAQDEWKVSRRLTVNAGVRYDLQFLRTIDTDADNVSPRVGFAWSPGRVGRRAGLGANAKTRASASTNADPPPSAKDDNKSEAKDDNEKGVKDDDKNEWRGLVVRGSFGLFYDRVPLRALANALLSAGNTTDPMQGRLLSYTYSPGMAGAPVFPGAAATAPAGALLNYTLMNRHLQSAYAAQVSVGVEQQVSSRGTVAMSYQHVRGIHLLSSYNTNINMDGSRPDPTRGNIKPYDSRFDSYYDGLEVSLLERPVAWGMARVSYTWSKAIDDVGEFFFSSPLNNFDFSVDRSRSDDDERHRVVVDAMVNSPETRARTLAAHVTHGWRLSGVLQYYSRLPFNITTGANTLQQTAARPCVPVFYGTVGCAEGVKGTVIGRNAGTGFDYFVLNPRVSRTFRVTERVRVEGLAEAFNALNHRNDAVPNGTFGGGRFDGAAVNGSFGQATAVNDGRSLQVGVRVGF